MPLDKNKKRFCIVCQDQMKIEDTPSKYYQWEACKPCRDREEKKPPEQLQKELVEAMELL